MKKKIITLLVLVGLGFVAFFAYEKVFSKDCEKDACESKDSVSVEVKKDTTSVTVDSVKASTVVNAIATTATTSTKK